jgi:DNA polymerase-3 subunit epsilon
VNDSSIELPEWAQVLAVFDTETTGIAPDTTRIVTANVSILRANGEIESSRDWLINPGIEIPAQATAVHGITTEYARENGAAANDAVYEIVQELQALFDSSIPVVAYNAAYDFTILQREAVRYSHDPLSDPCPVIDPFIIDWKFNRYRKGSRKLDAVAAHYGVSLESAHNAAADAIAAGNVAQAIARKYSSELTMSSVELHAKQVVWAKEKADALNVWLQASGKPFAPSSGIWPVE